MQPILVLLLLMLVSGVFAMSELAVVSSRRILLEQRANKGDRLAASALRLANEPTRFLSTVQLCITFAAILAGALGESALSHHVEEWLKAIPSVAAHAAGIADAIVVAGVGYVTLVIGELVPKRIGMAYPEPIARVVAKPMHVISWLTAPVVRLLSFSTDVILKLMHVKEFHHQEVTEDEIKGLIEKGTEAGVFQEAEQEIVERVFRLGDQRVSNLMVPRADIDWLEADSPADLVRVAVATSSRSHFPVCRGGLDHLIGVVHVKDLVKSGLLTKDIDLVAMAQKPLFVPESMPALKALETFRKSKTHVAFVLDEYGTLEGLITVNDIVAGTFGEMTRAGEEDENLVVKRADGSMLIDGMLPVDELKRLLGVDALPKEDASYHTVGGLMMAVMSRVPKTGDIYTWERFTIEVVDMDRQRVDKVLLSIAPEPVDVGNGEEGE